MPKKPASPATEQMVLSSREKTSEHPPSQPSFADFDDTFEFQDDVHGPILLNRLERDVVDTPEFRRLFHLRQLGFVDLFLRRRLRSISSKSGVTSKNRPASQLRAALNPPSAKRWLSPTLQPTLTDRGS
jgi:hypothetical protein